MFFDGPACFLNISAHKNHALNFHETPVKVRQRTVDRHCVAAIFNIMVREATQITYYVVPYRVALPCQHSHYMLHTEFEFFLNEN